MTIIVAGERSGVGKTTITLALLAALRQRGLSVQSFKVGPDYIDPMFHRAVTGRPCRNLDPVLTSEAYVQHCFNLHRQGATHGLIEGVMGLFDGASGEDDFASTAHIARLLNLPVLLILNCRSIARSIAAIAHGYRTFDPCVQIAGVVLNRVGSDRHLELLKAALEPLNLPILGILRQQDHLTIPDRHLGLVPAGELPQLPEFIDRLAQVGEAHFDWQKLLPLLACRTDPRTNPRTNPRTDPVLPTVHLPLVEAGAKPVSWLKVPKAADNPSVRIAVAADAAFNFYYADNLDLLEQGAEVVYWSPLKDPLPSGIQGLYFGGGFPELFAAELEQNQVARQTVRAAIQAGMPTYAECGGLMYLSRQIVDFSGKIYPMVDVLPTTAQMGERLTLGYRRARALQSSSLVNPGDQLWGHEFHRSTLTHLPKHPLFHLQGYQSEISIPSEGWQPYQVHASYVHLHFGSQIQYLSRWMQRCAQFPAYLT